MKRIFKKILFLLIFVIIFILIYGTTYAGIYNIISDIKISQFKSKGVYQEDISTDTVKYYMIEANEKHSSFQVVGSKGLKDETGVLPGSPGDILLSRKSSFTNPFLHSFISFYVGGHAALCLAPYGDSSIGTVSSDGTEIIESTGMNDGDNPSIISSKSYWSRHTHYNEEIAVRVKMSDEELREVQSNAMSMLDDPYNFSYLFDTINKSYCSDLISKSFKSIGVNLNRNGFVTTIYDILDSPNTYISYYSYYKDDITYIYFLQSEEDYLWRT